MDVVFADDRMRNCPDHAAYNLAVLRHFVLNLIRLAPIKRKAGLTVRRVIAATSNSFRAQLLDSSSSTVPSKTAPREAPFP